LEDKGGVVFRFNDLVMYCGSELAA